ncbi:hypothetical protein KUCAC02_027845, partial [Chaenocephalus aceratus]
AGSVLPHGDAGPFPVSVAGPPEGAARGSVLPGRGPRSGPGAQRQRPLPELRPGPLTELEEASRLWKGAAQAMSRLRERGRDGCLAGLQVQHLFCSNNTNIPEHQLKELNMKIDSALQAYKAALESLGHSEYALKAGFHLNPKPWRRPYRAAAVRRRRLSRRAGCRPPLSQSNRLSLPQGVSFNESAADNLKLKTHTMLQLIKEALGQNGVTPRDDPRHGGPEPGVPLQLERSLQDGRAADVRPGRAVRGFFILRAIVCQIGNGDEESCLLALRRKQTPERHKGEETFLQHLGQGGARLRWFNNTTPPPPRLLKRRVVVDTAQIENKEAYAPQITLEGSKVIVQVPSTCGAWIRRRLWVVDVLYTAVFDINRWKERKEQSLPTIQLQLQRETPDFNVQVDLPPCSKTSSGLPKSISKLTSKFTKKVSSSSNSGGSYSIPSTPSRSMLSSSSEDKSKGLGILQLSNLPGPPDPSQLPNGLEDQGMNLPTDQEMQDVIDFLSGFNMGKSQQASPLVKRRNSVASANPAELKPPSGVPPTSQSVSHSNLQPPTQPQLPQNPPPRPCSTTSTSCSPSVSSSSLPPLSSRPSPGPPPQQRAPSKWLGGSSNQQPPPPQQGPPGGLSPLGPIGQWGSPALPDLSSDLYSLGLVSTYMDSVMSEMLGQKPQGPRNNTWPNRDQSEGVFGVLGDTLPFDPAVGSDPEFARYVAGVSQAMQRETAGAAHPSP